MAQRVILDIDNAMGLPVQDTDDAMALALALASPELDLIGVATCAGNCRVRQSTANTLRLLEQAGTRTVPVAEGRETPLKRDRSAHFDYLEAKSAGDGRRYWEGLPPPRRPQTAALAMAAHEFTAHRAVASARITYVALGALTNLALAMAADPGLAQRLAGLVHMGGSFDPPVGEPFEWTTPDIPAEIWRETLRFNTHFDPEASALVFRSGIPLTLIPANVTAKVFQRLPDIDRLEAAGTPYHRFLAAYGRPWVNWSIQVRGLPGAHMHDPLTVAALIAPDLFRFQRMRLEPEALLNGTSPWLIDTPGGIRARVAVGVDATRFEAFLADRLCQPVLPRYRL